MTPYSHLLVYMETLKRIQIVELKRKTAVIKVKTRLKLAWKIKIIFGHSHDSFVAYKFKIPYKQSGTKVKDVVLVTADFLYRGQSGGEEERKAWESKLEWECSKTASMSRKNQAIIIILSCKWCLPVQHLPLRCSITVDGSIMGLG